MPDARPHIGQRKGIIGNGWTAVVLVLLIYRSEQVD